MTKRKLTKKATIEALRGEARLLSTAGIMLLAVGLPLTLGLVAPALNPDGISPLTPLAIGGGPVLVGYLICVAASWRLSQAKKLSQRSQAKKASRPAQANKAPQRRRRSALAA
jgi:hypothetical protein